jgi:hypothetical protein
MAQAKKDLEKSLADCKTSRDSIQKAFTALTTTYDSINKRFKEYDTMYAVIRSKYIGFDFNPARLTYVVDSLRAMRDSTIVRSALARSDSSSAADFAKLTSLSADSIHFYKQIADSLREANNHYNFVFSQYFTEGSSIHEQKELAGLWKVHLQWFEVAQADGRTGLVMKPASSSATYLASINFVDGELAELTLNNGTKVKCFYKVNGFSATSLYSIDFSKWKEVDNRLFVNPSGGDLHVSYQKGNGYFHGFMRKQ